MNLIVLEILDQAQSNGKITLLSTLHSYKSVISKHEILNYSPEGSEIYKTLLNGGREKQVDWHKKYAEKFGKKEKLELKDLTDSEISNQQSKKQIKSDAAFEDFPKTEKISLNFELPIQEFRKNIKNDPKKTLASSFFTLQLRKKSLKSGVGWLKEIQTERKKSEKSLNKTKKNLKAQKFSNEKSIKKALEGGTKATLFAIRKKVADSVNLSFLKKKIGNGWKKALKKREILKGMAFTAKYIHDQGLQKKVILALARKVHSSMIFTIKLAQISEKRKSFVAQKCIQCGRVYINYRLTKQILNLKSSSLARKNLICKGFKKFEIGTLLMKAENDLNKKAKKFYKQKVFNKVVHVWFSFISAQLQKKIFHNKSTTFYEKNLKIKIFCNLIKIQRHGKQAFQEIVLDVKKNKQKKIFFEGKNKSKFDEKDKFSKKFYFLCYILFFQYFNQSSFEFHKNLRTRGQKKIKFSNFQLQRYIKEKIMIYGKNYTSQILLKKQNFRLNRLKIIFLSGNSQIKQLVYNKNKESVFQNKKTQLFLSKIVKLWFKKYSKIRKTKRVYKEYCLTKQKFGLYSKLQLWLKKLKIKLRHKKEKSLVPMFSRKLIFYKYLSIGNKKYLKIKKKQKLAHKSEKFLIENLTLKSGTKGRKTFLDQLKLNYKSTKTSEFYIKKLIKKTFKHGKIRKEIFKQKNYAKAKAADQLEFVYKVKSIQSGKNFVSFVKCKILLYNQLAKDRNTSLKKKILKLLRIYSQYKIKNRTRDKILYNEIFRMRKKKGIDKWLSTLKFVGVYGSWKKNFFEKDFLNQKIKEKLGYLDRTRKKFVFEKLKEFYCNKRHLRKILQVSKLKIQQKYKEKVFFDGKNQMKNAFFMNQKVSLLRLKLDQRFKFDCLKNGMFLTKKKIKIENMIKIFEEVKQNKKKFFLKKLLAYNKYIQVLSLSAIEKYKTFAFSQGKSFHYKISELKNAEKALNLKIAKNTNKRLFNSGKLLTERNLALKKMIFIINILSNNTKKNVFTGLKIFKIYKTSFFNGKEYSSNKKIKMSKVSHYRTIQTKELIKKIFQQLNETHQAKVYQRKTLKDHSFKRKKFKLKSVFLLWNQYFNKRKTKKMLDSLAFSFLNKTLSFKYLKQGSEKYFESKNSTATNEKSKKFYSTNLVYKVFNFGKFGLSIKKSSKEKKIKTQKIHFKKILQKMLNSWTKLLIRKNNKETSLKNYLEKKRKKILCSCMENLRKNYYKSIKAKKEKSVILKFNKILLVSRYTKLGKNKYFYLKKKADGKAKSKEFLFKNLIGPLGSIGKAWLLAKKDSRSLQLKNQEIYSKKVLKKSFDSGKSRIYYKENVKLLIFTAEKHYKFSLLFRFFCYWKKFDSSLKKKKNFFLISKVFYPWKNLVSQLSATVNKALLSSVFYGWKNVAKENRLLKKYLLESDLSDRFMRSSGGIEMGRINF